MKFGSRGSATANVVISAAILVFVLLPVFSIIIEKYILLNKIQIIRDAADVTNISVYNAMNAAQLGKVKVSFDYMEAVNIYKELLSKNLNLSDGLAPLSGSIAEETVSIETLELYTGTFPVICPLGSEIKRPAVHSCIIVPVRPSLYRRVILALIGKSSIELRIHVDSDIPVNN